jgi:hypothetical protein
LRNQRTLWTHPSPRRIVQPGTQCRPRTPRQRMSPKGTVHCPCHKGLQGRCHHRGSPRGMQRSLRSLMSLVRRIFQRHRRHKVSVGHRHRRSALQRTKNTRLRLVLCTRPARTPRMEWWGRRCQRTPRNRECTQRSKRWCTNPVWKTFRRRSLHTLLLDCRHRHAALERTVCTQSRLQQHKCRMYTQGSCSSLSMVGMCRGRTQCSRSCP